MARLVALLVVVASLIGGAYAAPPVIDARQYGVQCNGAADDTAEINAALAAAARLSGPPQGGAIVQLPPGFCLVSGTLNITRAMILQGVGIGHNVGTGNSGGTVLRATAAGIDIISIRALDSVQVRDLAMDSPSVLQTGGQAGIRMTGAGGAGTTGDRNRISNVRILNMVNGIVIDSSMNLVIDGVHIQDFLNYGIEIKATGAVDASGHAVISNSVIWDLNVGTSAAGVIYRKGGDWRLVNSKILGSQYGFHLLLDDGPTGTVIMTGNSFEEQRESSVRVSQSVTQKNFGNLVIVGNQFSQILTPSAQATISVTTGTPLAPDPKWIKNISIVGNVFNNAHNTAYASISVQDGDGVVVAANAINGNYQANPFGIDIGGNVTRAKVTGNYVTGITSGREYTSTTWKFKTPTAILQFSSGVATVAAGSTVFLGHGAASATEGPTQMYIPYKAAALNLYAHANAAPGAGQSFTYTLRVGAVDSALTTTTSNANSDSADRTNAVVIPDPGGPPSTAARVSLKLVTSAGAAVTTHNVTVQITETE